MNQDQLKRAAYRLCELRGQDPEKVVMHGADPSPDGSICDVCLYAPRWQLVAREIEHHNQIQSAIEFARLHTNYSASLPK